MKAYIYKETVATNVPDLQARVTNNPGLYPNGTVIVIMGVAGLYRIDGTTVVAIDSV